MSAETDIRAAILDALRNDAALIAAINGIYDGPPLRAAVPYAVVGDALGNDWGTKDALGREVVLTVSLYDRHEDAGRLAQLCGAIHAAMAALPRTLSGWSIGSVTPLRSRLIRGSSRTESGPIGGQYSWQSEWRLRALNIQNG
jgi:hypothetical protein